MKRSTRDDCVALAFDAAAVESTEGRCTVDLVLRLLAREWPCVAIVDLAGRHSDFADGLAACARSVNPHVRLTATPEDGALALVVGDTAVNGLWRTLYIGSHGWIARFSPEHPVGSGKTSNPFGAAVAACLGVANAYRVACSGADTSTGQSVVDDEIELSVFDYSRGPAASDPELPRVDLGSTHLVGLDGVGGAAAWALTQTADLSGTLHLIDAGTVGPAVVRRHVLASQAEIGASRVDVCAAALAETGLRIESHRTTWGHYVSGLDDRKLERVAVASGARAERADVQYSLPRVLLNAWTQREDVGVSRHLDFLRAPCLACLYSAREVEPSMAAMVAAGIGLPEAEPEVMEMLYDAQPVDRALLERVAAAKGVKVAPLLPFVGTTAADFYHLAVDAGAFDSAGASDLRGNHRATAFEAALAGVLLAAELVVDAAVPRHPLPALTRINPMRPLAEHLNVPAPRDPHGRCICSDADYRQVYARKYLA